MTINSQSIFTSSFHSEKTSDCQMKKLKQKNMFGSISMADAS